MFIYPIAKCVTMDILGLPKAKISNFAKQISLQKRSVRKTVSACFVSGPGGLFSEKTSCENLLSMSL